jgi:uncharacterized membrane protein YfcA
VPDLTIAEWAWAAAAAVGVGISKAGFPGMSLAHVIIFAMLFGARESTGVVLPMLIAGDLGAIGVFYPHTQWDHLRRMLPPACVGVVLGAVLMGQVSDASFAPILGWIILILTVWTARGTEPFSTDSDSPGTEVGPERIGTAVARCWRLPPCRVDPAGADRPHSFT